MKQVLRIVAVSAILTAMAMTSPPAGADTTWTKISTDYDANIAVPSVAFTGSTAVVVWTQQTGPQTSDLDAVSFTTSPTQDVAGQATSKVADTWASLDYPSALFPAPGGALQLAFGGIHSTAAGDALIGMFTSARNADGSWAAPVRISSGGSGGNPSAAVLSGAIPLIGTYGTGGINIFTGAVDHANGPDQNLQVALGGCCGYSPELAFDSAGRLWIAWYSNAAGATGIYIEPLDPATGAPLGPALKAPESESANNNSFGTALACAATCRVVYGNSPAGTQTDLIVSWSPGQGAPTTIANLQGTSEAAGRVVTAAYRADGRLWVAWWDGKTYRVTLGDAAGAGGAVADAGRPQGAGAGAYALVGTPAGDNLLLTANFNYKAPLETPGFGMFVNTVAPPAAVTPAPGPRDVQLQTTPGGRGFRIQVQYTMPSACTGAAQCTLRAELRTRNGRRLYALSPLPGDGKVVLGTRPRVVVPKGTRGKIRFYITVNKAQLLKAPFATEGGSRIAETRLRVWYTPRGGATMLSVRDGRIKVSIARIKSGALPGLRGIL
ncbi:MAG: hypothetical protein QOK36_2982 [Gaiellales bacterium]|nr:hypothetical protein [Gaiellales bacterium]